MSTAPAFWSDRLRKPVFLHELSTDERELLVTGEVPLSDEQCAALATTINDHEFRAFVARWDGNLVVAYYRLHRGAAALDVIREAKGVEEALAADYAAFGSTWTAANETKLWKLVPKTIPGAA